MTTSSSFHSKSSSLDINVVIFYSKSSSLDDKSSSFIRNRHPSISTSSFFIRNRHPGWRNRHFLCKIIILDVEILIFDANVFISDANASTSMSTSSIFVRRSRSTSVDIPHPWTQATSDRSKRNQTRKHRGRRHDSSDERENRRFHIPLRHRSRHRRYGPERPSVRDRRALPLHLPNRPSFWA
jgi:hypothetical protein